MHLYIGPTVTQTENPRNVIPILFYPYIYFFNHCLTLKTVIFLRKIKLGRLSVWMIIIITWIFIAHFSAKRDKWAVKTKSKD